MAGDHKCPVCQSTFTRPQHVARHMRSHTGDRPYKCQHCGDAFARSDLLSRHVNKCHSAEKAAAAAAAIAAGLPPPSNGKGRKGRSAVSTKAPCDQCTISKLSCNSGEPCTKCIAKNVKCTYSQLPKASLPSLTLSQPSSLANPRPRNSFDNNNPAFPGYDYQYSVPPSLGSTANPNDQLYDNLSSSLPPQFTFPPSLSMYASNNPGSASSSAVPMDYYSAPQFRRTQGQQQDHMFDYSPPSTASSTGGFGHPYSPKYPTANYSQQSQLSDGKQRGLYSGSVDNASSPELQHGLSSSSFAYLPPSAANDGRPQTAGGGFSNAFGLMTLDDPNVLAGLASHSPFFYDAFITANANASTVQSSALNQGPTMPSQFGGVQNGNTRDLATPNARALREMFAYMRTPSDRTARRNSDEGATPMAERPIIGNRRVSRRASVPNIPKDQQDQQTYHQMSQSGQSANLKEYEAAVLARGPPLNLKLESSSLKRVRSQQPQSHNNLASSSYNRDRHVLPPGRNAPFIGPQQHGASVSPQSSAESSPAGFLHSHAVLPHPHSRMSFSSQETGSRPKPKRNASQTLEQELQKSSRNSASADVTGEMSSTVDESSSRESRSSIGSGVTARYGGSSGYSMSTGPGLAPIMSQHRLSGHSGMVPSPTSMSSLGEN